MGNAIAIFILAILLSLSVRAARRLHQERRDLQPIRLEMLARANALLSKGSLPAPLVQRVESYLDSAFPRPLMMVRALFHMQGVVRLLKNGQLRADVTAGQPRHVREQYLAIREIHDRLLAANHPTLYRVLLIAAMICSDRANIEALGSVRSANRTVLDEAAYCVEA